MKDKFVKDKVKALGTEEKMVLIVINEAIEYSGVKESDAIIDIDTHKFYEHCKRKFYNRVIERNCKYLGLDKHFMEYTIQMQFLNTMNHLMLYDVEKIRLLELAEKFIKDYKDYLNK